MPIFFPYLVTLVLFWSVGRYIYLAPLAFDAASPWWTYVTFSFAHANIFHLILNLYAIVLFGRRLTHLRPWFLVILLLGVPFLAALLSANLCSHTAAPTVGASAAAFSLVGAFTSEYRIVRRKTYYTSLALSLLVPFFIPAINASVHLAAVILGFLATKAYYHFYYLPRTRL